MVKNIKRIAAGPSVQRAWQGAGHWRRVLSVPPGLAKIVATMQGPPCARAGPTSGQADGRELGASSQGADERRYPSSG